MTTHKHIVPAHYHVLRLLSSSVNSGNTNNFADNAYRYVSYLYLLGVSPPVLHTDWQAQHRVVVLPSSKWEGHTSSS